LKIYISQGSVATQLRCLSIFSALCYKFAAECAGGKNWKSVHIFGIYIDKSLRLFWGHPVYSAGIYLWIWIYPWISTQNLWIWIWIWMWNFISTATLILTLTNWLELRVRNTAALQIAWEIWKRLENAGVHRMANVDKTL